MLPIGSAQATPVYKGFVQAIDYIHPIQTSAGTTSTPMGYSAAQSGTEAVSKTDSANGGSVDVRATAATNSGAGGYAQIDYRVFLTGPLGTYVPIRIMAAGLVNAIVVGPGSLYSADASFVVNFQQALEDQISGYANISPGLTGSFVVDRTVLVYAGSYFDVELLVSAGAGGPGSDPGFAHAFVDPSFTIAPAFAALYRLEGIPGVTAVDPTPTDPPPTSSVPEPETWAIWLLGLAAFAYERHGRRSGKKRSAERVAPSSAMGCTAAPA